MTNGRKPVATVRSSSSTTASQQGGDASSSGNKDLADVVTQNSLRRVPSTRRAPAKEGFFSKNLLTIVGMVVAAIVGYFGGQRVVDGKISDLRNEITKLKSDTNHLRSDLDDVKLERAKTTDLQERVIVLETKLDERSKLVNSSSAPDVAAQPPR